VSSVLRNINRNRIIVNFSLILPLLFLSLFYSLKWWKTPGRIAQLVDSARMVHDLREVKAGTVLESFMRPGILMIDLLAMDRFSLPSSQRIEN